MSKTSSAKLPSEVAITSPEERSEKTKPATLDLQVLYNFVKDEILFFIKCNNHCIKKLHSEINYPLWIYCNEKNMSMLTIYPKIPHVQRSFFVSCWVEFYVVIAWFLTIFFLWNNNLKLTNSKAIVSHYLCQRLVLNCLSNT